MLRFDQDEDALRFDTKWLGFALPLANRTSHLAALHDCHVIAEQFAERSLLLRKARTLRRRLAGVGNSYLALLDDVRRDAAIHLMEQTTLPVAEVAGQLGYAESASFRHAFRRWTALSPSQYRS